jgi:hypothetical protein
MGEARSIDIERFSEGFGKTVTGRCPIGRTDEEDQGRII